jgi:hypothetical protein
VDVVKGTVAMDAVKEMTTLALEQQQQRDSALNLADMSLTTTRRELQSRCAQCKVLLEYEAAELGTTKFDDLPVKDQEELHVKAAEWHISYVFLGQSGKQNNKLKDDLKNDFTKNEDCHTKNMQEVLHLLANYTKSAIVTTTTTSEGSAFAQRGGNGGNGSEYSKKWWEDKDCYYCNKKGHPATHCPKKAKDTKKKEAKKKAEVAAKNDDDKSCSSKSSKSSSLNKLSRDTGKLEKTVHSDPELDCRVRKGRFRPI